MFSIKHIYRCLLLTLWLALPIMVAAAPPTQQANCLFFTETTSGKGGFYVCDDAQANFRTAFNNWGLENIGYPISQRYIQSGFVMQAFQKGIMQWRPESDSVVLTNSLDDLHNAGFDDILLVKRQTPAQLPPGWEGDLTPDEIVSKRLALLDGHPALREAYFASPDPLFFFGLPTSKIEDMGNHFAIRLQRTVLQEWKEDVPWAKAGEITIANAGDLAKELGTLPAAKIRPLVKECSNKLHQEILNDQEITLEEESDLDQEFALDEMFWVGDVTQANETSPVLVLVHGTESSHETWTGDNQATQDGCQNGFRVAAVDLEGLGSIWDNARLLSTQLELIANYYDVDKVNIMAHSRGGVETQIAIAHYNADSRVDSYIAFSSPFGGAELVDYACSFVDILPLKICEKLSTVRVGYMSFVRSITDEALKKKTVDGYLVRGKECLSGLLQLSCDFIPGTSDGIVSTQSAFATTAALPLDLDNDLNHLEVHQTQHYDPSIFSLLGPDRIPPDDIKLLAKREPHFVTSTVSARDGELTKCAANCVMETVAVENGVEAVNFRIFFNPFVGKLVLSEVMLVSPSGKVYKPLSPGSVPQPIFNPDLDPILDVLLRLFFHEVPVQKPEAGEWKVMVKQTSSDTPIGYMLHVDYEGGLIAQLDTDLSRVYAPGDELPLNLTFNENVRDASLEARLYRQVRNKDKMVLVDVCEGGLRGQHLTLPNDESRTYHLELYITGTTANGTPFERTIITSVAAIDSNLRENGQVEQWESIR